MRKPDQLRAWLLRSVAGLADQPERLHLWVENGRLRSVPGKTLSYEYRYELIVIVEDFSGETHDLVVPVLAWLSKYQSDLLRHVTDDGLPINHDILGNSSANIEIKLALKERVIVNQTPAGGWQVEYPAEAEFPESFAGGGVNLAELYLRNPPRDLSFMVSNPDDAP